MTQRLFTLYFFPFFLPSKKSFFFITKMSSLLRTRLMPMIYPLSRNIMPSLRPVMATLPKVTAATPCSRFYSSRPIDSSQTPTPGELCYHSELNWFCLQSRNMQKKKKTNLGVMNKQNPRSPSRQSIECSSMGNRSP